MTACLYQRASAALPGRFAISAFHLTSHRVVRFRLKDYQSERRERHSQREKPAVNWKWSGLQTTEVSLAAPSVERSIGVQDFLPGTLPGDAYSIVLSENWREITNEKQLFIGISTAANEANDAPLGVFAVDPLKSRGIAIQFIQGAPAAIQRIEIPHPARQSRVKRVFQQMPIEA